MDESIQVRAKYTWRSGKGKAWESAIEICKELAFQHAEVTFN